MKRIIAAMGLGLGLCSSGCAIEQASGAEAEELGAVASEATVPSPPIVDGWAHGPFNGGTLDPIATHVCVLTRIKGGFRSPQNASALLTAFGENWVLVVDGGAQASAYCFLRSEFAGTSTQLGVEISAHGESVTATSPHSFSYITGLNGSFWNTSPEVRLTLPAPFKGYLEASSGVRAFARAFGVGVLTRRAQYVGFDDQLSTTASDYFLPARQQMDPTAVIEPPLQRQMAPVSQAICGFSRLSGGLYKSADYVSIEPVADASSTLRWTLRTNSTMARAEARCYARNQR